MDVAVAGDSQQFEELALAAAKGKVNLVRKIIGDEKADVSCTSGPVRVCDEIRRTFRSHILVAHFRPRIKTLIAYKERI